METKNNTSKLIPQKGRKDCLQDLIRANNHLRIDGKPASFKTQQERANYLHKMFNDLADMHHPVFPQNFKEKHISLICEKMESDGLKPPTIQTYLSFIKAFCIWIRKEGMMKNPNNYFSNKDCLKRTYQATSDKSWEGNGIDKTDIFREISTEFPWVWIQMLMIDAFGLRRKEAVCMRPFMNEKDGFLFVYSGGKGGRMRTVTIETDYQREVLKIAQRMVGRTSKFMADPNLTLEQNMSKISNTMSKFKITKSGKGALGVTLHGLRSGFVMRKLEASGVKQIFRTSDLTPISIEEELLERLKMASDLGHNRPQSVNAYSPLCTDQSRAKIKQAQAEVIQEWLPKLKRSERYKLGLILGQNPENEVVPDVFVERVFLQICQLEAVWYFQVEEGDDFEGNLIPIHHIVSIYHL